MCRRDLPDFYETEFGPDGGLEVLLVPDGSRARDFASVEVFALEPVTQVINREAFHLAPRRLALGLGIGTTCDLSPLFQRERPGRGQAKIHAEPPQFEPAFRPRSSPASAIDEIPGLHPGGRHQQNEARRSRVAELLALPSGLDGPQAGFGPPYIRPARDFLFVHQFDPPFVRALLNHGGHAWSVVK